MRSLIGAAVMVLGLAAMATADVSQGQLLPKTRPGGEVSLSGANLDAKKVSDYLVTFQGAAQYSVPVEKVEKNRLVLRVPGDFTPGPYLIFVRVEAGEPQFVAQIEIVAVTPQIVRVAVISTWWKLLVDGQFDFKIVGDRLCIDSARTQRPCDDGAMPQLKPPANGRSESLTLFMGSERREVTRCPGGSAKASEPAASGPPQTDKTGQEPKQGPAPQPASPPAITPKPNDTVTSDTLRKQDVPALCYYPETAQALTIHGLDVSADGGPYEMAIEIAGLRSNSAPLRVSRVTPRMIKWMSVGVLVAFVATFALIGTAASPLPGKTGRTSLLTWALLDSETNTYSLSKVQLLLWTFALVFGYLYLLFAFVLGQGTMLFPPLPASLSWLIVGSGGTTLAAVALSKARGPKGAGSADPTFSDLLSTGGVLAADRAQFFVWTLIGVGGFILLVLRQMPDTIVQLPDVPTELLTAMGLSAGVYVLGKTVRLPGPVITTATVTSAAGAATFDLKIDGQNLHERAVIGVDGQLVADATRVPPANPPAPNPAAPGMLPQLVMQLPGAGPWTTGDHLLRVTNMDGQFAEIWFAANLPKLTTVAPLPFVTAGAPATLTLAGTDLRPGSTAAWLPPTVSEPKLIDAKNVAVDSANTSVTLTFDPGAVKGVGTLTIVSPRGMRASHQVEVK